MGQKTDTKHIFQIGKNNKNYIWDSKYYEKKKNESNIFIFQNIHIKKFIEKILKDNGLALYKYRISFLESSIKIFISYIKLPKFQTIVTTINNNQKLRLVKNNKTTEIIGKNIKEYFITKKFFIHQKNFLINKNKLKFNNKNAEQTINQQKVKIFLLNNLILNKQKYINENNKLFSKSLNLYLNYIFIKKTQNKIKNHQFEKALTKLSSNQNKIKKRIKVLQYYKYYIRIKNNKIIKNIKINNFLEKIIESLTIFTNNKFNIVLNLQLINKNLPFETSNYQFQYFKKIIIQLRQFKKSKFFKEGINTIYLSITRKESAQLLANFIAKQLKLVKRHGFFLKFIKKALSLMLTIKLVKATSIKIIIKGRFNGNSRAKKKIIIINKNMPLMTINSKIDSAQSTAYGSNGTLGVKLWVNEKI